MRNLLVLTLFVGSLAAGCQNANLTQTPQVGDSAIAQDTINTPASTTTQTQTPPSPNLTKTKPSVADSAPVATSPSPSTEGQQTCKIGAYVTDKDPNGLNVRSGPGESHDIIGNLPTTKLAVLVKLTASQGSWVQVSKAESPGKVEFQGTGWVYAPLLGTSTRGYGTQGVSVYQSTNTQSSVVGRIPSEKGVKLLGCNQSWALVEYEGIKGWIEPESQCPNPLTTCP